MQRALAAARALAPIKESWAALFQATAAANRIPNADLKTLTNQRCVIRAIVVDLKAALDDVAAQGLAPAIVFIYADVVTVPAGYEFTLTGSALVITARLVEVQGGAKATLVRSGLLDARIIVFAAEIEGSMAATGADSTVALGPLDDNAVGVNIALQTSGLSRNPLANLQTTMLVAGSDFYGALTSSFQFATALFETKPEIADRILQWIITATSPSADFRRLFLQASGLAVLLRASAGKTPYVPELSMELYKQEANVYLTSAVAYESNYKRLLDQGASIADRKAAAQLLLSGIDDNIDYTKKVINQVKSNLDSAIKAVASARRAFSEQRSNVARAKVEFKAGLDEFQIEKRAELAVKIIGAIVEFATAAGELAIGDGPQGAQTVEDLVEEFEVAEETAKSMLVVVNLLTVVNKLITLSDEIFAATQSSGLGSLGDIQRVIDALASTTGSDKSDDALQSTAWNEFRVQADNQLGVAVSLGVKGSTEYKTALDFLCIRGQAMTENQLASTALVQELVRLSLQLDSAVSQRARMAEHINGITEAAGINVQLLQMAHDRYLDTKRSLFATILNYRFAFQYWALQESQIQASMVRDVADVRNDLQKVINDLFQDYEMALQKLRPIPQPLLSIVVSTNDADILGQLRTNKTVSWSIPADTPEFSGFDRIRITNLSVFLDGAVAGGKPIYVSISSSGNYADKLRGQTLAFAGPPVDKVFSYVPDPLKIDVPGAIVAELQYAFFIPTPFTTWTITLPDAHNASLDLSGLTGIRMEFAGSVMKSVN